jgi:hypothetical protein
MNTFESTSTIQQQQQESQQEQLNNANHNQMKTLPKPILKKPSTKLKIKHAPLFFTGNEANRIETEAYDEELNILSAKFHENYKNQQQSKEKNHHNAALRNGFHQNFLETSKSFDEISLNSNNDNSACSASSSLSSSNKRTSPVSKQRQKASAVYIFHSTEINTEIIKMLIGSIDIFVSSYRQTFNEDPQLSDRELFLRHKEGMCQAFRDHFMNDDSNIQTAQCSSRGYLNQLGASLSMPNLCKIELYRNELKKSEKEKVERMAKQTKAHKLLSSYQYTKNTSGNKQQSGSDPNFYGSLPATSFLDQYGKELKLREEVLLKSLRTKENVDSLILSHNHNNKSKDDSTVRNKCIVSTATTTKKAVRFADSFGLDLERVRIITNNSFLDAFSQENLQIDEEENEDLTTPFSYSSSSPNSSLNSSSSGSSSGTANSSCFVHSKPFLVLIPLFSVRKSDSQVIKLDNYIYDYENKIIKCIVRVKNICYEKRVYARITFNNWKTSYDLTAFYINSETIQTTRSHSQTFDYFGFCIIIPERSSLSSDNNNNSNMQPARVSSSLEDCIYRIEFALCFEEKQSKTCHWDSNGGENYKFQCFFNKTS